MRYLVILGLVVVAIVATMPNSSADAQLSSGVRWHDDFCYGEEVCTVGDFDGDGYSDFIAFVRSTKDAPNDGDIWVALSTDAGTQQPSIWHDSFCYAEEVCVVGDFNGDGKDDIIAFVSNAESGSTIGTVWVALSTGSGFGQASIWQNGFCSSGGTCAVGDFNGDSKDDIAHFMGGEDGIVWVSLSVGNDFDATMTKWHDSFCYGEEVCTVGDFNGDNADDIIAFVRSTKTGAGAGDVWVALSTESSFGEASLWHDSFCYGDEVCTVGDFNYDNRDDIVAFVRSTKTGDGEGDVWVGLAIEGEFWKPEVWHDSFCYGEEMCAIGDIDGDHFADVIAFAREAGDIWISINERSYNN